MTQIEYEYRDCPKTNKKWLWQKEDKELWRIMIGEAQVDCDTYCKYLPENRRNVAIQAGGANGYVPWVFSHKFTTVYTFEPNAISFYPLAVNTVDRANIIKMQAALGAESDLIYMQIPTLYHIGDVRSVVGNGGRVPVIVLDDLFSSVSDPNFSVDLMQFDTEGFEYNILKGGIQIIEKYRPLVVVENFGHTKNYGSSFQDIENLLKPLGYSAVDRIHGDVIFQCKS